MMGIREMRPEDIEACVYVYRSAYAAEPWKEEYAETEVRKYLKEFMEAGSARCYVQTENGNICGLALTILIPGIGAPYLRIEDFCMAAEYHRKGLGSRFLKGLAEIAKEMGCDSILLGTQKNFPSHRFYLKNGFHEIESVLLYQEIE